MIGKLRHSRETRPVFSQTKVWAMGYICSAIVAFVLFASQSGSSAETNPDLKSFPAPKHVVVPKLHGPVVIDGELNEQVWAEAALLQPFLQSEGGGPEPQHT